MLKAPLYSPPSDHHGWPRVGLAVESMRRHMTNEGWELFSGLNHAGYSLCGYSLDGGEAFPEHFWSNLTNVDRILQEFNPSTVVIQDKREWEGLTADRSRDPKMRFTNVTALRDRADIFKVTVLKDAHSDAHLHQEAALEAGIHAWIVYYNPDKVKGLAPYVRREHLIRTYHSLDPALVPPFSDKSQGVALRQGSIVSGALGRVYPLRTRIVEMVKRGKLPTTAWRHHPGYHRNGCDTPKYLQTLSKFKVAICTASIYDYTLRKIVESTACGCVVVTNLTETMPEIDENLRRVPSDISDAGLDNLLSRLEDEYDPEFQQDQARKAQAFYDYRAVGKRLADDIESLRRNYNG